MKYRKKPIEIEAIQWTGDNIDAIIRFMGGLESFDIIDNDSLMISTLEDGPDSQVSHYVSNGDYIVKGIQGEFYAVKPDIFVLTYEEVK